MIAQTASEAIRLGVMSSNATARNAAMGGAFSALGGDFASIHHNPASLGIYRSNEFVITPSLDASHFETSQGDELQRDQFYKFNFRNIGFVGSQLFTNLKGAVRDSGIVALNASFGYNKTGSSDLKTSYSRFNPSSSILHSIVDDLNANGGTNFDHLSEQSPFSGNLAWQTYLINPLDTTTETQYSSLVPGGGVEQMHRMQRRSHITNWDMALAINYSNQFYLGMNVGLPFYRGSQRNSINESDIHDSIPNFNEFTYTEVIHTDGWGVFASVGMIYKLTHWLRIGGSLRTPTVFSLNDSYYYNMESDLDTFQNGTYEETSPTGSFRYLVYTPGRYTAGLALVLMQKAIVSVDLEHLDYSNTYFDFTRFSDSQSDLEYGRTENKELNTRYQSVNNYKGGVEYRVSEELSVRAGYAYYGNPDKSKVSMNKAREVASFGLGYRSKDGYYIDLAFVQNMQNGSYTATDNSIVNFQRDERHIMTTLGFRF